MLPHQHRNRRSRFDKLEYDTDSETTATLGESIDSNISSVDYSLEHSTVDRKKEKWSFDFSESRSDWEQHSDRHVMYLLAAFTILFFMQVWGFHSIGKTRPIQPWSPYSTINPNIDWCPQATCHNSPLCHPCDRKFLIIIATGRSGSTTLTNMIDLLPGVRMAGENNGHLAFGYHEMENLEETEDFKLHSRKEIVGAWRHHPIAEQSTSCPIQHMFEIMNPPSEHVLNLRTGFDDSNAIIGFKTIRFHDETQFGTTYEQSVEFLMKTFPCARFIINIRGDVEAQKSSWFKAFGTEMDGNIIRGVNRRLENIAAYLGQERARLVDMSEWSQKNGSGLYVLNEMIEWLGFKGCQFPSLLHSNKDGYGVDFQKYSLGDHCERIDQ